MLSRCGLGILLAATMVMQTAAARAQDLAPIRSAGSSLLAWLISLRAPLDTIVAREKKDQLRRQLVDLNMRLYETGLKIEDLVRDLERPNPDRARITAHVADFRTRVDRFRSELGKVGPLLLQEHRAGGSRVEDALRGAAASRAALVERLEDAAAVSAMRPGLATEGRATLIVLRRATKELSVLIRRLG
jgi:hypothetical protein